MAVLSWISFIITIAGLFPLGKIVKSILDFFNGTQSISEGFGDSIMFIVSCFLIVVFWSLRRITKNQTRHPLCFNFAVSGYGKRLTLEKIHIDKCPQCGGNMKYYNKSVEWREILYNNGKIKREITKRVPVLECKRNSEHCYDVDPAEERMQ